ncbi:MAG: hypothetical protein AB7N76_32920 [Planctomycetota bacterium]
MPDPAQATQDTPEAAAVSSAPKAPFLVNLHAPRGEDNVESVPYRPAVTCPRRPPSYVTPVPYHPVAEAPSRPTCWLQLWEMDRFQADRWLTNEETDYSNPERNQLLASIPGVVVRNGAGGSVKFEFRALGGPSPTRTFDPLNGQLTLELMNAEGAYQTHAINLGEYESILELAVVLVPRENDATLEQTTHCSSITFVHNVLASARRQIAERGGIAISFVSDYDISNAANDPKQKNDSEISLQSKSILGTHPTFTVKDGKLRFGPHLVKGYSTAPQKCQEVRAKVAAELRLATPPKIASLMLFAHGIRQKIQLNPAGYDAEGSLRVDRCHDFVTKLRDHLGDGLVVSLFACNNGRGRRAGGSGSFDDSTYSHPLVGEVVGADSLGWAVYAECVRQGLKDVTVWAHTTAGHTTRNAYLRVFSSWGHADFTSVLFQGRNVAPQTYRHYASRFAFNFETQERAVAMARLSNSNKVRSMSVQSARYLPWAWQHGVDPDEHARGYSQGARTVARAVFDSIDALMEVRDLVPQEWEYEDCTKLHITGRAADGPQDAKLSLHFGLGEFTTVTRGALRLGVRLVQGLEILRDRTATAIKVCALLEGGDAARIKVNGTKQQALLDAAQVLVNDGLLVAAFEEDGQVLISTSGLSYSRSKAWFSGCRSDRRDMARVAKSIPWAQVSAAGAVHRGLCEAAQYLIDTRQARLQGVLEGGAAFQMVSDDLDSLERAASALLCEGKDGVRVDRVDRCEWVLIAMDTDPELE